jgi:hypothetical protein
MAHMKISDKRGKGRGSYRERFVVVEGGREFRETIMFSTNSTYKGYAERGTIDTDAGNPHKEAQYAQRIVAGSINVSILEEAQNVTKWQIHNLTKAKKTEAEISMAEVMGNSALSDNTDTLVPHGVRYFVSLTNDTVGTIDMAANAKWRPYRDETGVTAWNTSDEGLIALDTAFENTSFPPEKPDVIVTTPAVKTLINVMMIRNLTINIDKDNEMASLGYDNVKYRGATVLSDDNVPAQRLYLLNTAVGFRFQVLSKGNFEMTKFKQPIGGLYSVAQLYVFANFTSGALRLNGVMTLITG